MHSPSSDSVVTSYHSYRHAAFLPHPSGEVAYWIVPAGRLTRHATTVKPGAVPDGAVITALCTLRVRWPFSTPPGGAAQSVEISDECPGCRAVVREREIPSTRWDG